MKIRPSSILSVTILYLVVFGLFLMLNSCGQALETVNDAGGEVIENLTDVGESLAETRRELELLSLEPLVQINKLVSSIKNLSAEVEEDLKKILEEVLDIKEAFKKGAITIEEVKKELREVKKDLEVLADPYR